MAGVLGSLYPRWPVSVVGLAWACVLLAVAACACSSRAPRLPGRRARAVRFCGVRPRGRRALLGDVRQVLLDGVDVGLPLLPRVQRSRGGDQIDTATAKASTNPMVASTSFRS